MHVDDETLDDEDVRARHEALQVGEAVLVDVLKELYEMVAKREMSVKQEWEDSRALLEQKKWTMEQQLEILEKEVSELQSKIAGLDRKHQERSAFVQAAYRKVLHSFYLINNPEKLRMLDGLLNYYQGREYEILDKIKERYGIEVDAVPLVEAGVLPAEAKGGGQDEELQRLNKDRDAVWDQVAQVEELVLRSNEEFERVKRELYFPRAEGWRFKQGFDGVYVAMNDFWLEALSMRLSISVMDRTNTPGILVVAGGSRAPGSEHVRKIVARYSNAGKDSPDASASAPTIRGGVVSFRLDKCGLYGEKGTKIPSMRPDQLRLLVEFTLTVPVQFSSKTNSWKATSGFAFKILRIERKIKGSIYLPRSLLRMVLNRVLPSIIKKAIVAAIPVELGHYLCTHYESLGKTTGASGLGKGRQRPANQEPPMHLDLDVNVIGDGGDLTALDANMSLVPQQSAGASSAAGAPAPAHHIQAAKRTREILGLSAEEAATFVALQHELDLVYRKRSSQGPASGHRTSSMSEGRMVGNGAKGTNTPKSGSMACWPGPLVTATDLVQFFMRFSEASFAAHQWRENRARVARGEDPGTPPKEIWEVILSTWQQLVDKYSSFFDTARVDIYKLFARVRRLTLKPMRTHIELSNVRLRGSVDATVMMLRRLMERQTQEMYKESLKRRVHLKKSLERCMQDIQVWFREAMHPIQLIKQSLHAVSLSVQGQGAGGNFSFSGEEISFEGPANFGVPFEPMLYPPTHFAVRTAVNEDQGAFSVALTLAPFLDPNETVKGPVLELSLVRLYSGVFFDVNAYLASRMLEFKNMELTAESQNNAAEGTTTSVKPNTTPTAANGEVQGDADHVSDTETSNAYEDDDSDDDEGEEPLKQMAQRRVSDVSTSTIFDGQDSDNEDDSSSDLKFASTSTMPGAASRPQRTGAPRRSSATTTDSAWLSLDGTKDGTNSTDLDDEDEYEGAAAEDAFTDKDFDPSMLEKEALREFELSLGGAQDSLDDEFLGAKDSREADDAATNHAYAQSALAEGSMDRFLHHFSSQLTARGEIKDKAGLEVMQAKFSHDQSDKGPRFAFRVDTHELSILKAGADHVEVSGSVAGVVAYIRGWLTYIQEQAKREHAGEGDVERTDAQHPGLARCADLMVKYIDNPEVKFSFTFQVHGGTRKGHLVGSLLQGAAAGRHLAAGASASVIESPINLLELCADAVNTMRSMYESSGTVEEMGYFW
ncbi:Hypothetical Protein FCC1311_028572 [Hondaea fermentalgiana]|uniref:Uncharacterized protein n=1 Tax=Hondaea fermentalgiana TaxID=2315210 RepID=A0A2R5G6H1_9STRA|nr:Hypothetical Protein FCC1311_028572 [Hondaea fermentalgiana]|eukprot:GBG26636.1 Hypothetical Protein FCC1311_028572 [Hondaea fermentalgiana]